MRNILLWTLSILLGFEPALWAQGTALQQAEVKAFLEKSGIAKHPVTIRELYEKNSHLLPFAEKETLKNFVETYGNYKLPKMDVIKVRGTGGKEYYQLQTVQSGRAYSLEIINHGNVFAKFNGKTLTMQDMRSVPELMEKMGVSTSEIQRNFARSPASLNSPILTAEQIQKLSHKDRVQYFKKLRQLLESMEAVEGAFGKQKTSSNDSFDKFEIIARWLQGESAWARGDGQCVAAGWVATTGLDQTGRLKCGTDGGNGVAEEYRRKADGSLCPKDKFACNPAIYGGGKGVDLCIAGGPDTTKTCNERIQGEDIPDLAKNGDEFEKLRVRAVSESESVWNVCSSGGSSEAANDLPPQEDVPAPPVKKKAGKKAATKKKASKKKAGGNMLDGLDKDQKETCRNFKERYDQIREWGCDNKDFASKYPQICEKKAEPVPVPAPPVATQSPAAPPVKPAPTGPRKCEDLPLNQAPAGTKCEGGNESQLVGPGNITCLDGDVEKRVVECKCDQGQMVARFKCPGSGVNIGGEVIGAKRRGHKDSGTNWWLIGAFGLGGILLFYWLNKKAVDEQAKQYEPVPPGPILAPPSTISFPTPRGVN